MAQMGQYIIILNLKSTEETSYFISNYVFEKKVIGGTATTIKNQKKKKHYLFFLLKF